MISTFNKLNLETSPNIQDPEGVQVKKLKGLLQQSIPQGFKFCFLKFFPTAAVYVRVVLDVELSITSGLGKTTRRENVVTNDIMEKFEEEPVHDEAFATRIKQEVVLLATQAEKDHVSKLSRPVWPKSSPTIPSSLFKNDFQTQVLGILTILAKKGP